MAIVTDPGKLNDLMEFDHVIRVRGGVADDADVPHFAPEAWVHVEDGSIRAEDEMLNQLRSAGWEVMTGYTGQYSYSGPLMHSSEFIGGGMARAILQQDGYYVALAVTTDEEASEAENWIVAYRPL